MNIILFPRILFQYFAKKRLQKNSSSNYSSNRTIDQIFERYNYSFVQNSKKKKKEKKQIRGWLMTFGKIMIDKDGGITRAYIRGKCQTSMFTHQH